jgi:alpha-acetolactate decarboxylase
MATNELYQYSIISALMEGVASSGISLSTLLSHGTYGLGTFRHLVGEMIVLDGQVYQMKSDGSVSAISDPSALASTITPFAAVTRFAPTTTRTCTLPSKDALHALLSSLLPDAAHNHFMAVRVTGVFARVTVRTVGGQTYPHEPLGDVGKHQASHSFEAVRGTVFGFRSPAYAQGLSVAGDHLHFITEDRLRGGHLLSLVAEEEVCVEAGAVWKLHLELPRGDREFSQAKLESDAEGIKTVEG